MRSIYEERRPGGGSKAYFCLRLRDHLMEPMKMPARTFRRWRIKLYPRCALSPVAILPDML
jgi:hypothetical protein